MEQNREWLERARERQRKRPRAAEVWTIGTALLWRGRVCGDPPRVAGRRPSVCLAGGRVPGPRLEGDLRPVLEARFIRLAKVELPARAWELAAETRMNVTRVTVRDQRSRWGSCTAAGVISLNWRLILTPVLVRDYIIFHELMHLREMNHSGRFWACVEEVCPGLAARPRPGSSATADLRACRGTNGAGRCRTGAGMDARPMQRKQETQASHARAAKPALAVKARGRPDRADDRPGDAPGGGSRRDPHRRCGDRRALPALQPHASRQAPGAHHPLPRVAVSESPRARPRRRAWHGEGSAAAGRPPRTPANRG